MTFASLVELYLPDMEHRLKPTPMQNKRYLIENRVLPFFKDLPVNQIPPAHVRRWQSGLLAEKLPSSYVKTINGKELIMDTKTPRSRRVIPLPERSEERRVGKECS